MDSMLLQHEQIHFNIAELVARKMRACIRGIEIDNSNFDSLASHILFIKAELDELDKKYDKETAHGRLRVQQLEWQKKIDEQLIQLKEYELKDGIELYKYKSLIQQVIRGFYSRILGTKASSLKDYYALFGNHSEDETSLFFKKCDNGKQTEKCSRIFGDRLISQSSHESLVLGELKKMQQLLYYGDHDDIDGVLDKMKILESGLPDGIDIQLNFTNGTRVTFVLNNVKGESSSILNIYLNDGSSVFSRIGTRPKNSYYKRLSKINDIDGFVNIRAGKGVNHLVISKVGKADIFFVYPNYNESWWAIETLDCNKGYVSKSKIVLLGDITKQERTALRDTVTTIYSKMQRCK